MGFRDLGVFNDALLARQGWRLLSKPDTLLHSVLQAKYFKRASFTSAYRRGRPSYSWQSIWGAKSLLLEGLGWLVGDGTHIDAVYDSWVPTESGFTCPALNPGMGKDVMVSEFIDHNVRSWDQPALLAAFQASDVAKIITIPLDSVQNDDQRIWHAHNSGLFTVKSTYWLGKMGRQRIVPHRVWASIWRCSLPPKV